MGCIKATPEDNRLHVLDCHPEAKTDNDFHVSRAISPGHASQIFKALVSNNPCRSIARWKREVNFVRLFNQVGGYTKWKHSMYVDQIASIFGILFELILEGMVDVPGETFACRVTEETWCRVE